MTMLKLTDSPRLYVNADTAANLQAKLHSPYLQTLAQRVVRDAGWLARTAPVKEGQEATYQAGTRAICSHLECLTSAWVLTGKSRYRNAAIRHLGGLLAWNHISCEANHTIPAEVELPFCLSYGELSATIGLMYDLFKPRMSAGERQVFMGVLDRFLMRAAVKCLTSPPWWANKIWSNWNGVCCGGMGIMALAFYDDHPEACKLIPFVEASLGEYFKSYIENGGGCAEGTGYWNYGMNYAMRYVLSWENATGKKHPALEIKELGKSLFFPLDFTGITFGDNDGWGPCCFYFMLARRLGCHEAAMNAAAYLPDRVDPQGKRRGKHAANGDHLYAADFIPTVEAMENLKAAHAAGKIPVARVYDGLDWAALADDSAFPKLRLAVRGGSSKITGHGMIDLLSFRCRVNGELMITDQQDGGYMATTFSRRGHEIYGRSIESKSTILVDGLGCASDVACDTTEVVRRGDLLGIRIDGSHIFMPRWKDVFIGRLVLLVENAYWLIVDHVFAPSPVTRHWLESRFHTLAEFRSGRNWASLKSGGERMQMTFAALGPAVMRESSGMPSQPKVAQTHIFRWMGWESSNDNLHVVAMNPGTKKLGLAVGREGDDGYVVEVVGSDGGKRTIRLNARLEILG